jgi:arylsulfatase A-like enzyme
MYQRYIKDYLRCIVSVDENLGELMAYLDQRGILDDTIILYTSDQGFFLGEHGWYDKRFMYEESIGIPLLVRYPKTIPAGTVVDRIVMNLDIAPTLLDMAGLAVPDRMQGESMMRVVRDPADKDWRRAMYYHYYEFPYGWHNVKKHYGIRTDRYKLIHFYDDIDAWELYDLAEDPFETNNLYQRETMQPLIGTLKQDLQTLRTRYGDTEP